MEFERIASGQHKYRVADTFEGLLDGDEREPDIDHRLWAIRQRIEALMPDGQPTIAGAVDFYETPLARPHDAALLVDHPASVGRAEDFERRVRQQLATTARGDVPDRVKQCLIAGLALRSRPARTRGANCARCPWRAASASRRCSSTRRVSRPGSSAAARRPRLADLADGARDRVLTILDGIDEDLRERRAQPGMVVARPGGLLALLGDGEAGVTFGVLDRAGVQVDELVAALDERLRAERQQHRRRRDGARRASSQAGRRLPSPASIRTRPGGSIQRSICSASSSRRYVNFSS